MILANKRQKLSAREINEAKKGLEGESGYHFLSVFLTLPPFKHQGPCPVCGGNDRFIYDARKNNLTWYCRGCEKHGDAVQLLQDATGKGFIEVVRLAIDWLGMPVESRPTPKPMALGSSKKAKALSDTEREIRAADWKQRAIPIKGSPGQRYLESRGISFSGLSGIPDLSFLPAEGQKQAAILALYRHADEAMAVKGYHRIILDAQGQVLIGDGGKKAKFSMKAAGGEIAGAGLWLVWPFKPYVDLVRRKLIIAEGIEDALSLSLFIGNGWAVVAGGGSVWTQIAVPQCIKEVLIHQDNDQAGKASAQALAERLEMERPDMKIQFYVPPEGMKDANEQLQRVGGGYA
ncbi:toprim domain-containing protein [Aestuariirhabdus sp. Z084]|uniref:toprim domain-containing protein n=1 Tax=Aestuariirhabdus haliotis TaxID=2918751 RepID=UPI00201B3D36|nr:toprim domain-containing protein [Aestuariirhabdus haliotis]MCL6416349.1 toprim domain-containing protein [Aestuariirhabdus haliotis]MCL6420338.1 toprim domain-containing protein [Aestuariirhabdus haliotis]